MTTDSTYTIVVSDIFGRTEALEKFASELTGTVEIFDPYHSKMMPFDNEDDAYSHFTSEIGLEVYTQKLSAKVKSLTGQITLIGFSVGASAIWKISNNLELSHISRAVLFYGSQIRHHTEVDPLFPIHLIFPKMEQGFSVSALISSLEEKKNVQSSKTDYLHGFMNYHSQGFNQTAYTLYTQALSTPLK